MFNSFSIKKCITDFLIANILYNRFFIEKFTYNRKKKLCITDFSIEENGNNRFIYKKYYITDFSIEKMVYNRFFIIFFF